MARAFAAEQPSLLFEQFEHVAIADLRTGERHAQFLQPALEREIGHQRADHAGNAPVLHALAHDHVQQLVAVVDPPVGIDDDDAVGVAVECDAEVCLVGLHRMRQVVGMQCADAVIDVHSVRVGPQLDHFGAEFVEHGRCDVIGGAVRAVDDDLQTLEVEFVRKRPLAEFDVAAGGIVQPAHLAEPLRVHAVPGLVQFGFDPGLDRIRQLGAARGEELDAVVGIGIVRGADDDAGIEP